MSSTNNDLFAPLTEFVGDARKLLDQSKRPDFKEFMKTIGITVWMFCVCGALGFAVRLLALPIKHILIGG